VERLFDWLYGSAIGRAVRPLLTRSRLLHAAVGAFADSRLSRPLIPWMVRRYGLDLSEAVRPPGGFATLNALFTRELLPGARPVDPDPAALASPADARLLVAGPIDGSLRVSVKGAPFSVGALVADAAVARGLAGGTAAVFRLYAADCHRLFFPCAGLPSAPRRIPGRFESVSPRPGNDRPALVLNRRTVTFLDTGRFARLVFVDVGGFLVGTIRHLATPGLHVEKGAPRSLFRFGGSTLVLLAPEGAVEWDRGILAASARGEETPVRIGQAIGRAAR
jgi:phosphatidylserine decarboxylase